MRRVAIATIAMTAAVVVLISGCGGSSRPSFDSMGPADDAFVAALVPHHELGLELVDDATANADDVELRHLAFEMQGYHSSELHRLHDRLAARGLEPLAEFPGRIDRRRLDGIAMLRGPEHDVAWLRSMIDHHAGAVRLADDEIGSGTDTELVALASTVVTVQSAEITRMTTMLDRLCAEAPSTPECD